MAKVSLADLDMAVDYATGVPGMDTAAYLDRESGAILYEGEGVDEPLPEDLFENERYIEIPDNHAFDLGRDLALEFTDSYLSDDSETVYAAFRRSGAYGRFKSLLERKGMLEKWHSYEAEARVKALADWCDDNGIEYDRD